MLATRPQGANINALVARVLLHPNPARPSEPRALWLPAGEGRAFVDAMEDLYGKIVEGVRNATEGERFKQAQGRVHRRVTREENSLETKLKTAASALGLELTRSADEVQIASLVEGEEPAKEALEGVASHIEEFEHQEEHSVVGFPHVEHIDSVRVPERCKRGRTNTFRPSSCVRCGVEPIVSAQ